MDDGIRRPHDYRLRLYPDAFHRAVISGRSHKIPPNFMFYSMFCLKYRLLIFC